MVTALWKVMADRTREPRVVAFGQRLVTMTDVIFTGVGAALVLLTGLAMLQAFAGDPLEVRWVTWGLLLFAASGVLWGAVLIPIQVAQSRLARQFAAAGEIPARYWDLGRAWLVVGSIAALLPLVNVYVMVFKPL
jgi:uncharacterized membrane protein